MSEGSHASGGSASTGHGGAGGSRDREPPVPYRDAPLDYSPPVFCSCNLKCLKLISWSDDNIGRRYYRCQNVWTDHDDCGYFRWVDPKCPAFLSTYLLDLRNAAWTLEREAAAQREANMQLERMYEKEYEKERVEIEKRVLEKEKQIQATKAALESATMETVGGLGCILFVFVVGFMCCVSLRKTA